MSDSRPFSVIQDGLPLWKVSVDDPQASLGVPVECVTRLIKTPQADIFAIALRVFDMPGRPQTHHQAGPWSNPDLRAWVQALASAGKLTLQLDRNGWANKPEREVSVDSSALLASLQGADQNASDADGASRAYIAFYKEQYPKLHTPEAVWDAYEISLVAPVVVESAKTPWWVWLVLGLALAAIAIVFLKN